MSSLQILPSIGKDPAIKNLSQTSIPGHAPAGFQPLRNDERNPEIGKAATQILNSSELGDQTPFIIDGIEYMGRTEPHYHPPPPAGEDVSKYPKPWGWHKGVTVFKSIENNHSNQVRMKLLQRVEDNSSNQTLDVVNQLLNEIEEDI